MDAGTEKRSTVVPTTVTHNNNIETEVIKKSANGYTKGNRPFFIYVKSSEQSDRCTLRKLCFSIVSLLALRSGLTTTLYAASNSFSKPRENVAASTGCSLLRLAAFSASCT